MVDVPATSHLVFIASLYSCKNCLINDMGNPIDTLKLSHMTSDIFYCYQFLFVTIEVKVLMMFVWSLFSFFTFKV